nr:hypothetical protein [Tanacetum cinerariifolium]
MASAVICLATVIINAQVDDMSSHTNQYTSPTLTQKVFANMCHIGKGFSRVETPLFATMLVQPRPLTAEAEDEVDEQPTNTFESSMTLLNTLMETYAILSQNVAQLEQDKIAQALEIIKLKQSVKKLEKKRRLKSSGLKRLRKVGRKDDNVATKEVSAAEPIVFDDEEVTMTMAQTLIKMKAEKSRLLDKQMAKRLHDEEVEQAAAGAKQEKDDLEKAKGYNNNMKYQNLKRKLISIAQARKNMIIYLKNMAGYKMKHFREESQKKRVAEETLLQESFKKLKAVEVSGSHSTQDTPTIDPKEMPKEDVQNMLEIIPVSEFKEEIQEFLLSFVEVRANIVGLKEWVHWYLEEVERKWIFSSKKAFR